MPKPKKPTAAKAAKSVDHDAFLTRLLVAFPKQVFLVGCYADEDLELPADGVLRVFLPDFHWMSRQCLERYTGGYHFTGNEPSNQPLFAALLSILEEVRDSGVGFELFQLGDRFDLWREAQKGEPDVLVAYDRVRSDPDVSGLATRLDGLRTQYIRGNHDAWLREVEAKRPLPIASRDEIVTAGGRIRIAHGHEFDNVEQLLSGTLKAEFVGLAPRIRPGTYDVGPFPTASVEHIKGYLDLRNRANRPDLYPDVAPVGARLLGRVEDVDGLSEEGTTYLDVSIFSHGSGIRNDFEHIDYLKFEDKALRFEQQHPDNHAVQVIGHTHHARILVDRLPQNGKPHVLLDCGGWIEQCTVRDTSAGGAAVVPSAQVGVQAGNDVRIYQLTSAPLSSG